LFLASAALAWRLGATGAVRRTVEPAADPRPAPPRFAVDAN
jgi:hypothetical protein